MADWINLIGRVLAAFYFLWAAAFNLRVWQFNLDEFRRVGIPAGRLLLPVCVAMQVTGSVLLLVPSAVPFGAALLVAFTLGADLFFHRYWTYPDPKDRTTHLVFLMEHAALTGGLLGLAAPHL